MRASLHAAVHAASPFLASILFALLPTLALAEQDTILVGAGDIAECWLGFFNGARGAEATATLLDHIGGTVFTIGDHAYRKGTAEEFQNCYTPTWGRYRARTRPTPGTHDYDTNNAGPYRSRPHAEKRGWRPNQCAPMLGRHTLALRRSIRSTDRTIWIQYRQG